MTNIVFIGLGNMGLPMALNLAKTQSQLTCFDLVAAARQQAAAAGLRIGANTEAAQQADCIITMLPSGKHLLELFLGDAALLEAMPAGALLIDCSTTGPDPAVQMAQAATAQGMDFIDAPVSGGIAGAQAATLSFLVGGKTSAVARAHPLLAAMGANIFHAGDAGMGQAAKLCNNMMLSIQMAGVCEALALGKKMGLDGKTLSDIMRKSSGGNWVLEKYNPLPGVMDKVPAANNYQGGFTVDLMVKDSDLALSVAAQADATAPLGTLANQIFHRHQKNGSGQLDFSSVINLYQP